jgi:hypothetical protein
MTQFSHHIDANATRIAFPAKWSEEAIGDKKLHASFKTADRKEAEGCFVRLEENLRFVERARLIPLPEADIPTFLLSDG